MLTTIECLNILNNMKLVEYVYNTTQKVIENLERDRSMWNGTKYTDWWCEYYDTLEWCEYKQLIPQEYWENIDEDQAINLLMEIH